MNPSTTPKKFGASNGMVGSTGSSLSLMKRPGATLPQPEVDVSRIDKTQWFDPRKVKKGPTKPWYVLIDKWKLKIIVLL